MWIVHYKDDDDNDILINAFSSEEKATAYRDAAFKYASIKELKLDPELPREMFLVVVHWYPDGVVHQSQEFMKVGYGFADESQIEMTWTQWKSYCARAKTVERAKELLVKSIPIELQKKYFLQV